MLEAGLVPASVNAKDAKTRPDCDSIGRVAVFAQPTLQGIGAKMLLHHEVCFCARSEPSEPIQEKFVERRLADPDRRIAPQSLERQIIGHIFWCDDAHIGDRVSLRVRRAEFTRPAVHIDRPHGGVRRAAGHRERDRPGTASEVD